MPSPPGSSELTATDIPEAEHCDSMCEVLWELPSPECTEKGLISPSLQPLGKEVTLKVLGRGVPPADWRGNLGLGQHGRQMDVGELEVRRPIRNQCSSSLERSRVGMRAGMLAVAV